MKRRTQKKVADSKKTGAKGCTLTELDNIILDIIGRDTLTSTGLGLQDDEPFFGDRENIMYG